MGVVELEAAFAMNVLPDYYFQAVGSGTGAIAAWETFSRLIEDGRFGEKMPRIVLSQNLPFAPMVSAWRNGRAELIAEKDMKDAEAAIKRIYADVLSTRNPPYSIKGGVYDMLSSTNGTMYGITNDECKEAEKLFAGEEGIDLDPAASVACASLIKAADEGTVKKGDTILLNITGGGYERLKEDCKLYEIEPRMDLKQPSDQLALDEIEKALKEFVRGLSV
jgi:cysteate synthase